MTGPQLRAARHRFGLTIRQLAKLIPCTTQTLRQWERQDTKIPEARAIQCTTAFALLMRSSWVVGQSVECPQCCGTGKVPAVYAMDGTLIPAPTLPPRPTRRPHAP